MSKVHHLSGPHHSGFNLALNQASFIPPIRLSSSPTAPTLKIILEKIKTTDNKATRTCSSGLFVGKISKKVEEKNILFKKEIFRYIFASSFGFNLKRKIYFVGALESKEISRPGQSFETEALPAGRGPSSNQVYWKVKVGFVPFSLLAGAHPLGSDQSGSLRNDPIHSRAQELICISGTGILLPCF